jgi:hypothetical protein
MYVRILQPLGVKIAAYYAARFPSFNAPRVKDGEGIQDG